MNPCPEKTNRPAAFIRLRRNLSMFIVLMAITPASLQAQQPGHTATDLLKTDSAAPVVMLPLKLLEFSGKSNKDIVQLVWTTAAETNINHYELEKSSNGIRFVFVNKQTGKALLPAPPPTRQKTSSHPPASITIALKLFAMMG